MGQVVLKFFEGNLALLVLFKIFDLLEDLIQGSSFLVALKRK